MIYSMEQQPQKLTIEQATAAAKNIARWCPCGGPVVVPRIKIPSVGTEAGYLPLTDADLICPAAEMGEDALCQASGSQTC